MAARNMFIEIYEYPYKFMTFARMLGRPHGGAPTGLCRNSQKINSFKNRVNSVNLCRSFVWGVEVAFSIFNFQFYIIFSPRQRIF